MTPRLYVTHKLTASTQISVSDAQAHYLQHVLRMKTGDNVLLFNGTDGEWCGTIIMLAKKQVHIELSEQTLKQEHTPDIWLVFAPIKSGRIDFLVEKATELGASRLLPVQTQRTIVSRVNHHKCCANAVEAAEQSQRLDVPVVEPYQSLTQLLSAWDAGRPLIYGDESGNGTKPATLLEDKEPPLAVLIGPEGGFSEQEFAYLRSLPFAYGISLGKRILRADTAALCALTLLQEYCGNT